MGPGSGRPAGPPRPRRGGAPGPAEGRAGAPPRPPRSPSANPDLDVAEARAAGAGADVANLPRLALTAVRRADHDVAAGVGDRVAGAPELVGDARVGGILEEPAELSALDLVGHLRRELEVQAPVVDAPGAVGGQVEPVVGVGHDVVEAQAVAGQEVDVRHADERDAVPAIGAHRAPAAPADAWRRLPRAEIAAEDAVLDERHALGGGAPT